MILEAYLAYSLIPLFYILLGILIYLVLRSSRKPEEKQQEVSRPQVAVQQKASGNKQA
ncbi:hypothetical protein [Dictyobacter kobayashii]|uniref:Uncharacterized protein n=1 Tax=Dictyobacter kobayashii TaxID=2014872 RepID=A0A402AP21_9CHLR|nr:hypothetical protein [Dictyobacter kobayashii]GCE20720.1 hypothetical protein KDK_45200 [Dictyobacter kobayashii]